MYTNYFVRQWLVFVTHMQELRPVLSGSIPQLLSNTNSEKTCYWCVFRARLGKNLSRTCLGVVCCVFRLFRQETFTHIYSHSHAHFNSFFVKFTPKNNARFLFSFGEASKLKNDNNKLVILAVRWIWGYGIIH